jgi:hypothetical protein
MVHMLTSLDWLESHEKRSRQSRSRRLRDLTEIDGRA